MTRANEFWEQRLSLLWQSLDGHEPSEFVAKMRGLTDELPQGDAVGLFELGSAQDSTGHPEEAVPLYEAALAAGLSGYRQRRAIIQLGSSLRNLGRPQEAVALLSSAALEPLDELSGAVSAFLALALVEVGREREAVGESLLALSRYLPRYNASLARYAREFTKSRAA